jgi:protein-S-isoprenylcysteine O-methyltransferase Ste14
LSRSRLLHAAANVGVALTFLAPLLLSWRAASLSAWISIIYVVMALLSLVRAAPREARTDYQAWIALSGMVILPLLIQPLPRSAALTRPTPAGMATVAVVFQSSGLVLMQVADLCLGRHFGLLPANRGLVTRGPFRLIRHPVYAAWLVYAFGTLMVVPTINNLALLALTIPFMVWRINLEEELLDHDPQYRAYRQRVRWRLVPGVF